MKKTFIVVGASRGIGDAVTSYFHKQGHKVYAVSRTPPRHGQWIQADISLSEGIKLIVDSVGEIPIDALLFMGGVWESNAFTEKFDFFQSPDAETRLVLSVNLIAPIEITKGLRRNLILSQNPRAIYIGALSGLDQLASPEVANTASKFGLRGAVQALRIAMKRDNIGFTVINPGNVATEEVLQDIEQGRFTAQVPIPLEDVFSTIEWVLGLSTSVEVGDINIMQK
jgi:NAD(P)-dependent dehydrogenase (short-subunit alcohol dehydrogenase family)